MPGAAHHALFDVPRIRSDFQHVEIMIRFEDQKIRFAQIVLHQLGHVAKIGDDYNLDSVRAEAAADWVGSVVRNGEGRYLDVANFEAYAGTNVFNTLDFSYRAIFTQSQNFAMGQLGQISRTFPFARHLRHGAGMVAMLVGNQDGVHSIGTLAAQRFEAAQHFLAAKTSINEESSMACLEQRAVARASRRQNGYSKRDCVPQSGPALRKSAHSSREDDGKLRRSRQQLQLS